MTENPEPSSVSDAISWISERGITEVECMIPDQSGIARGKILPTKKFLTSLKSQSLRLPESLFLQTVTGDMAESEHVTEIEPDIWLKPDLQTLRMVPWYEEPTAQIICDAYYNDGSPVRLAPRQVLANVLRAYAAEGWTAVVAPELEFYLCEPNLDPDYPLAAPKGKTGRQESGRQSYGIDAVNEFDPLFDDMYDYCEAQNIDIDTLIHEAGVAQVEINFDHGDPVYLADQVFLFKRTVRQAAHKHNIYATFMAKPHEMEPGSAMHIHQSVCDRQSGRNLFADDEGRDTTLFRHFIGGMQKYLPAAMPFFAPNVNSYRRVVKHAAVPINTHWGVENRTVGLRVPRSNRHGRRVENRIPGADANPYSSLAASLACGFLGMQEQIEPSDPMEGIAYDVPGQALPLHILDALTRLAGEPRLHEILGHEFVAVYSEVKQHEHAAYRNVISAWERQHLLLNV